MVFSIVLAVLYEGLKSLREYLMCVGLQSSWHHAHTKQAAGQKDSQSSDDECHKPLMVNDANTDAPSPKQHR